MKRQLKTFDIVCLGTNAIVGSGIFLIPGIMVAGAGPYSILLFLLCGLMLIPIGLCFAEASSRVDRNGGPYNYARLAFGSGAGFTLGWIAVVTAIFSYAAVADGLPQYLSSFIPGIDKGIPSLLISGGVIFFLTALNVRGVRLGANTINIFTVGKLLPLILLAVIGLFFISPDNFSVPETVTMRSTTGLLLAVLFTYQGFEVAPVPAGETIKPSRAMPIAVIGSLVISAILYMLIQSVIIGSGAPVAGSEQPLSITAEFILGSWAGRLIAAGAVISMFGYCAGIAFSAPRYLTILCEDKFLPSVGASIHRHFGTPYVASVLIAVAAFAFTAILDFKKLVDISALSVALQYLVTCVAIPRLRKKTATTSETYVAPGKWLFPLLGALISVIFIVQIGASELKWTVVTVAIGIVVSFITTTIAQKHS